MVKKILVTIFFLLSFSLLIYVNLPSPDFPPPPDGVVQSGEPADIETPLRRSYFTNLSREEIMAHYQKEFKGYRLNYRVEEAGTIIRDQARSTYLEEIVHPFRESVFINGFEPKDNKDAILIQDKPWRQKITVRYYPSSRLSRVAVALMTLVMGAWLVREYSYVKKRD